MVPRLLSANGEEVGGYDFSMHSARPILGYQNRGRVGVASTFRYQCMDAGSMSDDLIRHRPLRPCRLQRFSTRMQRLSATST